MSAAYPLGMAGEGERLRVFALRGGETLIRRLTAMGLNPGTSLTLVHRQGGGVVVLRGETRLAIGGGLAQQIMVVPAASPGGAGEAVHPAIPTIPSATSCSS